MSTPTEACDHNGIGQPGCKTCDPRPRSMGGPRCGAETLTPGGFEQCVRDYGHMGGCRAYGQPPASEGGPRADDGFHCGPRGHRWEPPALSHSTTLRELAAMHPGATRTVVVPIDGRPVTFGVAPGERTLEMLQELTKESR